MKASYLKIAPAAKFDPADFAERLERMCHAKLSQLLQAVLEAEVDEVLERVRYQRRAENEPMGYRDGHDRPRTIATNRGPVTIARPRVRGAKFESAALPKHRRKLEVVDRSITELWLDGLATRDFEGTLRAFWVLTRRSPLQRLHARTSACARTLMPGTRVASMIWNWSLCGRMASIWVPVPTTSAACFW